MTCVACAVSRATWLLFTGMPPRCVVLRVRCPGPLGSCSPVCSLGALCCVCGVLGHLAPVHRCARPRCCVAFAVSWATWPLFTGVPARCVVLRVRCPGPLGSCSPVCTLGVLCCVCRVLCHLAPARRCACSVRCVGCAVSRVTCLLFTGVPARGVVLPVRCLGPLGSCSPVCPLGALRCVCGVLGHLAPVHRCARSVRCVAFLVSWATWLLFTCEHTRRVVLRVRRPGPLGSCLPVCTLGVLCCVCGVLGHLAPVQRCARSVRCVAFAVPWATWLLFDGVHARRVVLRVRCPGPLGCCSPVCPLGMFFWVCSVLGHLAAIHRCVRSACCAVCAVSWATWLLFTGVYNRCVLLHVRCPSHLAPVHGCARWVCWVACAVSSATWLPFTSVLARCVVLCGACAVSWATWLLLTAVRAGCVVLRVRGVAAGRALIRPDGGFS